MLKLATFGRTHIYTMIGSTDIEVTLLIQTNLPHRRALIFGNEVFLSCLTVIFD